MRDAVFIVSPKMLNLGSLLPTTPLTQGPVWMPMRMTTGVPSFGIRTCDDGADMRASGWAHAGARENDDRSDRVPHRAWGAGCGISQSQHCGQNAAFYTHLL